MRAVGREVAIACGYFLEGLDGFEDLWDERRWAMWRDRHQRLGFVLGMVAIVMAWYALVIRLPRGLQGYGMGFMVAASCAGLAIWFGVAALSRSLAKG